MQFPGGETWRVPLGKEAQGNQAAAVTAELRALFMNLRVQVPNGQAQMAPVSLTDLHSYGENSVDSPIFWLDKYHPGLSRVEPQMALKR